jgi:hypothetical protein
LFSLSTFGFTLITTLISQDGLATLGIGTRQMCFGGSASLSTLGFTLITTLINHDGLATLGIGIRQLCFGYSASLRSALH